MSSLRVVNISPDTQRRRHLLQQHSESPISPRPNSEARDFALSVAAMDDGRLSSIASPASPSVFDNIAEEADEDFTDHTALGSGDGFAPGSPSGEEDAYNLKPPPAIAAPRHLPEEPNLEALSVHFFSSDHLDLILRDHGLALRLMRFLQIYRPRHAEVLKRYVEAKKAIVAVEYANSVANHLKPLSGYPPFVAAAIDERFDEHARTMLEDLTDEALPAYLTYRLVSLVSDTLVKEVTGNSSPILHDLIPSLAEVYCMTDPSVKDNPIVYASEEFYNITQYTPEFTIGRNCRFLQGPKSSTSAVRRMVQALSRGEECCETILNYKKDGTPFMNLLMLAPLYDNKGEVRYFLGAQIDVSSLIEGGRGLDSFAQLLSQDRPWTRSAGFGVYQDAKFGKDPKAILGHLGQFLSEEEEVELVKKRISNRNMARVESMESTTSTAAPRPKSTRVLLGMESANPRDLWPAADLGTNGRLPGVYQNYLLVRPYPSLRITFTSPSLRIPGLLQTKLLDRIGGPSTVREGLQEAFVRGSNVTAKVTWLSKPDAEIDGGRTRWLHCTPMLGSDGKVGVWMIVVVEDEKDVRDRESWRSRETSATRDAADKAAARRSTTGSTLYADYLRREGRSDSMRNRDHEKPRPGTRSTVSTGRQMVERFRDF